MTRRAIAEHDALGEFFDERYRAVDGDYHRFAFSYGRRKIDDLLRRTLAETSAGGRVLDVGCGTGEQLRRAADLGFRVSGVEPAERLRAVARDRVPEGEVVNGLATALPFDDATFDLAIVVEVLRYLEPADSAGSWDELARVLRPGGRAFVTLVNRWASDGYWLYHRGQRLWAAARGRPGPLHCDFTSPRRVRADLARRGFCRVQTLGCMSGKLRLLYKLGVGPPLARALEPLDDRLTALPWMAPFAGHLVVIAERAPA